MAFGTAVQVNSGTTNATFGAAPKAGNLLVMLAFSTSNVTFVGPANWTDGTAVAVSGGSARGSRVSWKVSDGTETGALAPSSGTPSGVLIAEYEGPFPKTPLDIENAAGTASGTLHTSPTVAPASGHLRLLVGACAVDATGRTWSTERVNTSTTGVAEDRDASGVLFHLVIASTTGTYNCDATVSGAAVVGQAHIQIFTPLFTPGWHRETVPVPRGYDTAIIASGVVPKPRVE